MSIYIKLQNHTFYESKMRFIFGILSTSQFSLIEDY